MLGGVGAGGGVLGGASVDVGSVRLFERHLHSDPPSAAEIAGCVADIDAQLDGCQVDLGAAGSVVGVAGSVITIAAGVLDLPAFDATVTDQAVLPVPSVQAYVDRLVAMTVARRRELPYMIPGRADVIAAGARILSRVLLRTSVETMVVSEADILDGIAWSMVG